MSIQVWFFKPTTLRNRIHRFFTRCTYIHCGIAHSMSSLAIYTDVRPNGIIPQPSRGVRAPDMMVSIDVDALWVSQWLYKKWAVTFPWHHALVPSSEAAVMVPEYDYRKITSGGLIALLMLDAIKDGATSDSRSLIAAAVPRPHRMTPTALYEAIKRPPV